MQLDESNVEVDRVITRWVRELRIELGEIVQGDPAIVDPRYRPAQGLRLNRGRYEVRLANWDKDGVMTAAAFNIPNKGKWTSDLMVLTMWSEQGVVAHDLVSIGPGVQFPTQVDAMAAFNCAKKPHGFLVKGDSTTVILFPPVDYRNDYGGARVVVDRIGPL